MLDEKHTILIVAYNYPPANNGGVLRTKSFVRHLPDLGWKPTVITTDKFGYPGGERKGRDVIHTKELSTLFRRTGGRTFSPAPSSPDNTSTPPGHSFALHIKQFLQQKLGPLYRQWLLIPDKEITWAPFALVAARSFCRRYTPRIILTTSPPQSAHLVGLYLRKRFRLPWVMDLRDPWTIEPIRDDFLNANTRSRLENSLERRCFHAADRIIVNTPYAADAYSKKYPHLANKFVTLTNGFDDDDFRVSGTTDRALPIVRPQRTDGTLLSHIGTFSRHGCRKPSPDVFLAAMVKALQAEPDLHDRLSVVFAGQVCQALPPAITAMGLSDVISLPGLLEHSVAVSLMLTSDYLLLYEDNEQGETYVRGKVYEYLRAGKPIIGVLPDGATRDLVARFPCARLFYPDDVAGLARALLELRAPSPCVNHGIENYDYRNLTQKLATLLDGCNPPSATGLKCVG